jgi:hypothetical protein
VSDAETDVLRELAREKSTLVELGVFEGRTSCTLRSVMHPKGTLWMIDPFVPGLTGVSWQRLVAMREIERTANGAVQYIRKMSWDAAKDWHIFYDLLFIDGDHAYEAVRRDWEDWSRFALPGGHIALHDSCCLAPRCKPTDGPVRVVEEVRASSTDFELVQQVESLSVFRRL